MRQIEGKRRNMFSVDKNTGKRTELSTWKFVGLRYARSNYINFDLELLDDKTLFLKFLLDEIVKSYLEGLGLDDNKSYKYKFYYHFHQNTDFILSTSFTYDDFLRRYPKANSTLAKIENKIASNIESRMYRVSNAFDTLNYITVLFLKTVNISDFLIEYITDYFYIDKSKECKSDSFRLELNQ